MARARNIKPGFYKNEDLAECSIWARFIFPGLWMLADREGRLEDRPKRIKGELLPFDSKDAEPLLNELEAFGFIERYEVDGRSFIQILAFSKHQNPHHREPESSIPPPKSPRLSPDGMKQKPEALPSCKEPEAQGKPEASPGLPPPKHDLARGVNRADSLIPDSLIPDSLIPDPGVHFEHTVSEPERPPRERPPDSVSESTHSAGSVCKAIRSAGIQTTNPSHPTLLALIESGATVEEFGFAAREAVGKGKADFAYVIGMVRKRREEASKLVLHQGRLPNKQEALEASNRAATSGWVPPELREKTA
jgi:hypothetical protein